MNMINEPHLTAIYNTIIAYRFFPSAHKPFAKINQALGHTSSLNEFQGT